MISNIDLVRQLLDSLNDLQEQLECAHRDVLTLYENWDWLKMIIEHEQGLDETDELTIYGNDFEPLVGVVDALVRIKSVSQELSELLGDEIQNIEVPGENYTFLYIPKGKPIITTHDYGSGQFTLPGDRCHVFKIYLKDENGDPDLV